VSEIERSHGLGACRVNAQVFGIKSCETRGHEAVKWRGGCESSIWRRQVAEIGKSRELRVCGLRAQGLGAQSHEDASSERRTAIGSWSQEDHWIHTWGRASKPREKRLKNLNS
jgi:hypothetical protein